MHTRMGMLLPIIAPQKLILAAGVLHKWAKSSRELLRLLLEVFSLVLRIQKKVDGIRSLWKWLRLN